MLPRPSRLTSQADFRAVAGRGVSLYTPAFRLKFLRVSRPALRVGIVISTKISKKATVRNRVRRQLRAAFRSFLPQMSQGFDIVVTVQAAALGQNYAELAQQLEMILRKARLLTQSTAVGTLKNGK